MISDMSNLWAILGISFLVFEIFTGSFFLLFFGLSALLTAALNFFVPISVPTQLLVFSVLAFASAFFVQKRRKKMIHFGKNIQIDKENIFIASDSLLPGEEKMINYQGTLWKAINHSTEVIHQGARVKIHEMQSTALIIEPAKESSHV